jgi:hypothetical protein
MPSWKRLVRFESTDGKTLRGEPILPSPDFDVGSTTEETGLKAKVIEVANNDIFDPATKVTDQEVTVKKLLGPVTTDEVPIIRCIGLNFIKHSMKARVCHIKSILSISFSSGRWSHTAPVPFHFHQSQHLPE